MPVLYVNGVPVNFRSVTFTRAQRPVRAGQMVTTADVELERDAEFHGTARMATGQEALRQAYDALGPRAAYAMWRESVTRETDAELVP